MARAGFLNEAEYRDYPFLTRVDPLELPEDASSESSGEIRQLLDLPQEAIVDFGAIIDLEAAFDETAEDFVYLHSLRRDGTRIFYDFRATSIEAGPFAGDRLLFTRDTDVDEVYASEWADASSGLIDSSSSSSSESGCTSPRWRGFLVTGRFAELLELLLDGEEIIFFPGLWQIEPARIQNLRTGYLRSINLANFARTHAIAPEACGGEEDPEDVILAGGVCLQGDVVLTEGFNLSLRQEIQTNSLVLAAAVGAGAGQPCEEIPLTPDEVSPDGGRLLTGGPTCDEIVKTINGVGGRRVTIQAGPGFHITSDPDNENTLLIDLRLDDFAICQTEVSSESLSE